MSCGVISTASSVACLVDPKILGVAATMQVGGKVAAVAALAGVFNPT
jgi:hypothetical protein